MSTENAVVAVYDTHSETEEAVHQVQKIGFGTEESFVGYYNTGDRIKPWGKYGAF